MIPVGCLSPCFGARPRCFPPRRRRRIRDTGGLSGSPGDRVPQIDISYLLNLFTVHTRIRCVHIMYSMKQFCTILLQGCTMIDLRF